MLHLLLEGPATVVGGLFKVHVVQELCVQGQKTCAMYSLERNQREMCLEKDVFASRAFIRQGHYQLRLLMDAAFTLLII